MDGLQQSPGVPSQPELLQQMHGGSGKQVAASAAQQHGLGPGPGPAAALGGDASGCPPALRDGGRLGQPGTGRMALAAAARGPKRGGPDRPRRSSRGPTTWLVRGQCQGSAGTGWGCGLSAYRAADGPHRIHPLALSSDGIGCGEDPAPDGRGESRMDCFGTDGWGCIHHPWQPGVSLHPSRHRAGVRHFRTGGPAHGRACKGEQTRGASERPGQKTEPAIRGLRRTGRLTGQTARDASTARPKTEAAASGLTPEKGVSDQVESEPCAAKRSSAPGAHVRGFHPTISVPVTPTIGLHPTTGPPGGAVSVGIPL